MIFPIRDENPQITTPYVTYGLIALNVVAWLVLQHAGNPSGLLQSICAFGLIPADLFYLLSGLGASLAQIIADTGSVVPMVGASGAIGGVMGAYIVLYPRVHVHMFVMVIFRSFAVPAFLMLGYWMAVQVMGGYSSLKSTGGGVAFWAHIGGFVAGAVLIFIFKDERLLQQHQYRGWNQNKHAESVWKRVSTRQGKWY